MKPYVIMNQNGMFAREIVNDVGYGEFSTDSEWVRDIDEATVFKDEPNVSYFNYRRMPVIVSVTFDFGGEE